MAICNNSLQCLFLSGLSNCDEFEGLAEILHLNKALRLLDLSYNYICREDLFGFSHAFRMNDTLQSLNLSESRLDEMIGEPIMDDELLKHIALSIKKNRALVDIGIPSVNDCSHYAANSYYTAISRHTNILFATTSGVYGGYNNSVCKIETLL
ncbi:MAG: hypothetical protein ACK5WS_03485 [Alphaproteobacteria bacterium]|jgi:hypothetical protein|nr:hypothetical protein [Candidatus Jidaibacter sp.]